MVSDLVSQNINVFLRNAVKITGVVVFMFSLSWQLSLVTFMGFPIIMMVSDIYGKYYKVGGGRGCGATPEGSRAPAGLSRDVSAHKRVMSPHDAPAPDASASRQGPPSGSSWSISGGHGGYVTAVTTHGTWERVLRRAAA